MFAARLPSSVKKSARSSVRSLVIGLLRPLDVPGLLPLDTDPSLPPLGIWILNSISPWWDESLVQGLLYISASAGSEGSWVVLLLDLVVTPVTVRVAMFLV